MQSNHLKLLFFLFKILLMKHKKTDNNKTKQELLKEMTLLRRRIEELETGRTGEKERAQQYLDIAGGMFVAIDNKGRVTMVNHRACEVLGYNENEIVGKDWFETFIPEHCREEVREVARKMLAGYIDEVEYYENPVLTASGEERLIEWHNTYISNEDGHIVGHLSSGKDITLARQAETALRDSEEKYRQLVENANEGIFVAQDWQIKFPNPKIAEILEYPREELDGKPFADLLHPDDRAMVAERYRRRLKGEVVDEVYRIRAICKSGEVKWAEIKPVRIEWEGRPATLSFLSDITARVMAEKERKDLEGQLHESHKMEALGALAGGIAHDFNNILGVILGYTELSLEDLRQENRVREYLGQVFAAAQRAKGMVGQILDFSRNYEQEHKPHGLSGIINEVLKLLEPSIPKAIQVNTELADGLAPVMVDRLRVRKAIMNLCLNAAQSMRETGGIMNISLESVTLGANETPNSQLPAGKYQHLTVADTGHGMNEETRQRVFEPYFTTRAPGVGSGMGLAVVHGIVTGHSGAVTVESELEKGSVFHVYLPEMGEEMEAAASKTMMVEGDVFRILLVEDEPALAEMVKRLLNRMGHAVEMKTDALEALDTFRSNPRRFDVVITDQTMPGITGLGLASEVKKIRRDMPVVLCSGFSEAVDERNYRARGVDAFLMKPILKKELADALGKILKS